MTPPASTTAGKRRLLLGTFRWPIAVTVVVLLAAFLMGGSAALLLVAVLCVLEISLSFDNAVVNAKVLERMSPVWQRYFLTVGILIAVFGMRLLFPLIIVAVTAGLNPGEAVRLAVAGGSVETPGTYANILHEAHPAIAAFGAMFLGMLFLDFVFEEREITWLAWLERPLARIGKLDQLSVVVAMGVLLVAANSLADEPATLLVAGTLGVMTYILVGSLGELFAEAGDSFEISDGPNHRQLILATGKAGFFLFLYLEVLDSSFSFDGVIGAFAITQNIIIIAAGLGVGAMYIRSLTVYLVHRGTLSEYVHLEHGAMWAIGALATILLLSIRHEVPAVVTGLVGVGFIATALITSISRNRQERSSSVESAAPETADDGAAAESEDPSILSAMQDG